MALPEYAGLPITEDAIHVEPVGAVKVEKTWTDGEGVPHITFSAGTPGKGSALVSLPDSGGSFEMQAAASGVVVSEGFNIAGWEYVCTSIILVIACPGILCASASLSMWRRAWYGFEIAACIGGALFFLLQAVRFAVPFLSGCFAAFSNYVEAAIFMAGSFVDS